MRSFCGKPFRVLIKRINFEAVSTKRREKLLRIVNSESNRCAVIGSDSCSIDNTNLLPDLTIRMAAGGIYEILDANS